MISYLRETGWYFPGASVIASILQRVYNMNKWQRAPGSWNVVFFLHPIYLNAVFFLHPISECCFKEAILSEMIQNFGYVIRYVASKLLII